jgi:hypothetical protein
MKRLNLIMEQQAQTQWCWAAVAVSTHRFYGGTSWTQCTLVNAVLDKLDCCSEPCPDECNKPWRLGVALAMLNHLASMKAGSEGSPIVQSQLVSENPLCARIDWIGGGGHFVIVSGYEEDASGMYVYIEDPIRGSSIVALEEFTHRYQGCGEWAHTYFTKG